MSGRRATKRKRSGTHAAGSRASHAARAATAKPPSSASRPSSSAAAAGVEHAARASARRATRGGGRVERHDGARRRRDARRRAERGLDLSELEPHAAQLDARVVRSPAQRARAARVERAEVAVRGSTRRARVAEARRRRRRGGGRARARGRERGARQQARARRRRVVEVAEPDLRAADHDLAHLTGRARSEREGVDDEELDAVPSARPATAASPPRRAPTPAVW